MLRFSRNTKLLASLPHKNNHRPFVVGKFENMIRLGRQTKPPDLEFFFDFSSQWTYLAFARVEKLAYDAGAHLIWRPILVGGVFNKVNPSIYERRANPIPSKDAYMAKDLADWAQLRNVRISWGDDGSEAPPAHPVNSVKAMRGCFVAMDHNKMTKYCQDVFKTYWTDCEDISQDDVMRQIVDRVGLPADEFFEKIQSDEYKQKLRTNTDELIERGGFGSPTMFINEKDMYFGNDRLELVFTRLKSLPAVVDDSS